MSCAKDVLTESMKLKLNYFVDKEKIKGDVTTKPVSDFNMIFEVLGKAKQSCILDNENDSSKESDN